MLYNSSLERTIHYFYERKKKVQIRALSQEIIQEMIKGIKIYLIMLGQDGGLVASHNTIWWNLATIFYVQAENRPSKRQLDGPLAKSLHLAIKNVRFHTRMNP